MQLIDIIGTDRYRAADPNLYTPVDLPSANPQPAATQNTKQHLPGYASNSVKTQNSQTRQNGGHNNNVTALDADQK